MYDLKVTRRGIGFFYVKLRYTYFLTVLYFHFYFYSFFFLSTLYQKILMKLHMEKYLEDARTRLEREEFEKYARISSTCTTAFSYIKGRSFVFNPYTHSFAFVWNLLGAPQNIRWCVCVWCHRGMYGYIYMCDVYNTQHTHKYIYISCSLFRVHVKVELDLLYVSTHTHTHTTHISPLFLKKN